MFSPKTFILHLRSMSGYIAFSSILFLAGIVIGGTNERLEAYITSQLQALGSISQAIESSANPGMAAFAFIFFNNTIKSILIMYLGAAFALVPIFFLIVNGMILGYVFTHHNPDYNTFELIARGILPHGILEIPAIIIAAAYGIKFGTLTFKGIGNLVQRKQGFGAIYEQFAIRTVPLMVALVIALLAAAVIEATITPWLLNGMKM
ncbi:stage II sporulation protein M [Paenibacillus sp. GCM10012307]|uniref:Stage II sporulation protein M n=1 Tax=Paenibacillus roseus TaxID=2798579 RepID=A0A934IXH4_9BACL|nr:stage II sporulation protein M [Paenibacillus roseus]MBJ6361082.1 stage II sporulation protein M [Paenibacillus roseus]